MFNTLQGPYSTEAHQMMVEIQMLCEARKRYYEHAAYRQMMRWGVLPNGGAD